MKRLLSLLVLLAVAPLHAQYVRLPHELASGFVLVRTRSGLTMMPAAMSNPSTADTTLASAWSTASTAGFPGALAIAVAASSAPQTNPYTADQVLSSVWATANTAGYPGALAVWCESGCGGGGGSTTIETNGVANSTQTLLNFITSTTNAVGLTITPSNPSGGEEKFEITGGSYTGNSATSTALAATPTQCTGSQFATGIAASGDANCATPSGGITLQTNTSNNSSQSTLNLINSTVNAVGLTGTFSNPSGGEAKLEITGGSYTGNAATATALASTPSQCSGAEFATGIAANGNANCSTPSGSGITLQTNGVDNSSQSLFNLINSTVNTPGIVLTVSNPSGGEEKIEATVPTALAVPLINTGSGSSGCGSATGCLSEAEGSTAATTASGADTMRADSTAHAFKCSLNGGTETACNPLIAGDLGNTPASPEVVSTHLSAALPVNQGGTGTTSTLTGIVRGGSPMSASELSGDATTSGSNAVTVVKVNGGSIPASESCVGTNSSSQIVAGSCSGSSAFSSLTTGTNTTATMTVGTGGTITVSGSGVNNANELNGATVSASQNPVSTNSSGQLVAATVQGNGSKVQLSTGSTVSGDCVKFDANGNTVDNGSACGGGTTLSTHGSGYVMPWGSDGYWTAGGTLAANDVYAFQFVCCLAGVGIDISTVAYYTSSTETGAYSAIGIYSSGSAGSCGTLIAQTTPLETATAGVSFQSITADLTQGTVYWLAITTDTTGWGVSEANGSYTPFNILQQSSYPREVHSTSSGSGASLAFPSSCGGTANLNHFPPLVALLP